MALFVRFVRDLNERQSQLLFLIVTYLVHYEAPELQPLIDEDITQATAAVAATFETALRGVIYEHPAGSPSAERLVNGLKPLLSKAEQGGGTAFQRDACVVLRRIEMAAAEAKKEGAGHRRAFLDMLGRLIQTRDRETAEPLPEEAPRVIIP